MRQQDILALGFMTFALFLGAGNIIYPPMLGQQAGYELMWAAAGFLLTAVGLPLLALVAMALVGGSEQMTAMIPRQWSRIFWFILFIAFGPALVIPRVAVVAYEVGMAPFLSEPQGWQLVIYSGCFFSLVLMLAFRPGALIKTVGRWMTPALLVLLCIIAWGTLSHPLAAIEAPVNDYAKAPFAEGFVQGYMTMDCIAALGFGGVIGQSIRLLGVTDAKAVARYSVYAGMIAAAGLGLVYLMLMYLGATSQGIAPHADNGGQILATYVAALFGLPGLIVLSAIISLACLTTAIGVGSSCAQYFSTTFKMNYGLTLTGIMASSAIVTNVGLTQLLAISTPAIVTLYPLAVALVLMAFLRNRMPAPKKLYRKTLPVVAFFSMIDGVNAAHYLPGQVADALDFWIPLFRFGMGWVVPFILVLSISWLFNRASLKVNSVSA